MDVMFRDGTMISVLALKSKPRARRFAGTEY
jgi:hypothetical protein